MINIWNDKEPVNTDNTNFTPYMTFHKAEKSVGKTVLVIPGGGYANCCDTYEGEDVAEFFAGFGVDAFVLRYTVTSFNNGKPVFPKPFLDIARAVRYIRANAEKFGVNGNCLGVMGFSAGSHLCAWLSTKWNEKYEDCDDLFDKYSARPDWCVLCYGVLDLHRVTPYTATGINLLGESVTEEMKESLSCIENVTKDTPPTFLFHTYSDQIVPVINSVKYYEAMIKCGVPGELHIYEPGNHGMGIGIPVPHIKEEDRKYCEKWVELLKNWVNSLKF